MKIKEKIKNENNKNNNMAEKYEVKGKQCRCPRCNFSWIYKGARDERFGFVQCPQCRLSRHLSEFMETYEKGDKS